MRRIPVFVWMLIVIAVLVTGGVSILLYKYDLRAEELQARARESVCKTISETIEPILIDRFDSPNVTVMTFSLDDQKPLFVYRRLWPYNRYMPYRNGELTWDKQYVYKEYWDNITYQFDEDGKISITAIEIREDVWWRIIKRIWSNLGAVYIVYSFVSECRKYHKERKERRAAI